MEELRKCPWCDIEPETPKSLDGENHYAICPKCHIIKKISDWNLRYDEIVELKEQNESFRGVRDKADKRIESLEQALADAEGKLGMVEELCNADGMPSLIFMQEVVKVIYGKELPSDIQSEEGGGK